MYRRNEEIKHSNGHSPIWFDDFPLKPPFSSGIFQPCLITSKGTLLGWCLQQPEGSSPITATFQSAHRDVVAQRIRSNWARRPGFNGAVALRLYRTAMSTQDKHRLLLSQHINDLGVNPWLDLVKNGVPVWSNSFSAMVDDGNSGHHCFQPKRPRVVL